MKKLLKIGMLLIMLVPSMFFLACSCSCGKDPEPKTIQGQGYKTEFLYNEDFSIGENLKITITMTDDTSFEVSLQNLVLQENSSILKNDDISIDYTAYKKNQIGQHEIVITYLKESSLVLKYNVEVKGRSFADSDYAVQSYEGVYDGKTHSIAVTQQVGATIKYGIASGKYNLTTAPTFKNAGEYTVYFKIEKEGYHPAIEGQGTVKINPAPLVITPKSRTMAYGERFINDGCHFEGFVNGEKENVLNGGPYYTTNYNEKDPISDETHSYYIEVEGYKSTNYKITYQKGVLNVVKAENALEVTIKDITYGYALTPEIVNPSQGQVTYHYQKVDEQNWIEGLPEDKDIGIYNIKITTAATNNYHEKSVVVENVKISKKPLVITPETVTIKYDQEFTQNNGVKFEGFVKGEDESVLIGTLQYNTNYQKGNPASTTPYTLTVSGYSSPYYEIEYRQGELIVKKADNNLVVSIQNVTYGETLVPVVDENKSGSPVSYRYQKLGAENWMGGLPTVAGKYLVEATSEATPNYELTPSNQIEVEIYQKELVVTQNSLTIKYNEDFPSEKVEVSYEGFIAGEDENVLSGRIQPVTDYKTGNDAGESYYIWVEGLVSNNYKFDYRKSSLIVERAESKLVVTMANVVYGEDLVPNIEQNDSEAELTYRHRLVDTNEWKDGLPNNKVGRYNIEVTSAQTKNYEAETIILSEIVSVNKKTLIVTPELVEIEYNQDFKDNDVKFDGFIDGEDVSVLSGSPIFTTPDYEKGYDIGTYTIEVSGYSSSNYEFDYKKGVLQVVKATNNLVFTVENVTYGEELVYEVVNPSNGELDYTYQENAEWNEQQEPKAGKPSNAGVYSIKLISQETKNYKGAEWTVNNVIINKKSLTVTPKHVTIKYGEIFVNAGFDGVEFDGFVKEETYSSLTGNVVYSTNYEQGSNVGKYNITISGLESNNYDITFNQGNEYLEVERLDNPMIVTVRSVNYGTILEYQPHNKPEEVKDISFRYRLDKEGSEWIDGFPTEYLNAGNYIIEYSSDETTNYNAKTDVANVEIKQKDLIITPNQVEIKFNEEFVDRGVTCQGFAEGEDESVLSGNLIFTTDYEKGNNANVDGKPYTITITGYSSNNYNIIYNTGNLIVQRAENTISVSVLKEDEEKNIVATYGNTIQFNETNKVSDALVVYEYKKASESDEAYSLEVPTDAGSYDIRITQQETTNYKGYFAILTNIEISQREVGLEWSNTEFTYDGQYHKPTVKLNNIINDDICEVSVIGEGKDANENGYTAVAVQLTNPNYKLPMTNHTIFIIYKKVIEAPTVDMIGEKVYTGETLISDVEGTDDYSVYQNYGGITAGEYDVLFRLKDEINHKWSSTNDSSIISFKFRITKATDNKITEASIADYSYGTDPSLPVCKAVYGVDFIISYKLTGAADETYTTVPPTTAGKYTAKFELIETESYNGCETTCEFEVLKVDPDLTYNKPTDLASQIGDTLHSVQLLEDWSWVDEDYTFEEEGTVKARAKYTPKDLVNYNSVILELEIVIVDNRPKDFNEGDITVEDIVKDYDGDFVRLNVVLSGTAEGAYVTYSENNTDFYDENPQYLNVGEYTVYIKVSKEKYNDYYLSAKITINDYVQSLVWNYEHAVALLKGAELDLSDYEIQTNYASGETKFYKGNEFEVENFDNNQVGIQNLTLKIEGRSFENVLGILVYEPFIEGFRINTFDENYNEKILETTKVDDKKFSVEFDNPMYFNYYDMSSYLTIIGESDHKALLSINNNNTVINEGNGTINVNFALNLEGYLDTYVLEISYNITSFVFNIGTHTSVYDSENDIYTITDVLEKNFESFGIKYGSLEGLYLPNTEEFTYENNLLTNNGYADLEYENYSQVIAKVYFNYVTYYVNLKIETLKMPITSVTINNKNFEVAEIEQTIKYKTTIGTQVVVKFGNLNGYYMNFYYNGRNVWYDEFEEQIILELDLQLNEIHQYFNVYKTKDLSTTPMQVLTIHLVEENFVESFKLITDSSTYDLEVNHSTMVWELVKGYEIKLKTGYTYDLYVNDEIVTDKFTLINSKTNFIALKIYDSNQNVVSYSYYEVVTEPYIAEVIYSNTDTFEFTQTARHELIVTKDKKVYLDLISYMSEDYSYETAIVMNGITKQFKQAIDLTNGINTIAVTLSIDGYLPIMYELNFYVYGDEKQLISDSEYLEEYLDIIIYHDGNYVTGDLGYVGTIYMVNSYDIDLDTLSILRNGEEVSNINASLVGNLILLEIDHYVEAENKTVKLFNIIELQLINNSVSDDVSEATFYHYDAMNNISTVQFDSNKAVELNAYNSDRFVIKLKNKNALIKVTNMTRYEDTIYVEGNIGETYNIIVEITSTDGTVKVTYTINVTIEELQVFSLSHMNSEDSESVMSTYLNGIDFYGDFAVSESQNEAFITAMYADQFSNYVIHNSSGQEVIGATEGYVKVSVNSVFEGLKAYKNISDEKDLPIEQRLKDKFRSNTDMLVQLQTDESGYKYYSFYIYLNYTAFKIKVYTLTATQTTTDITFNISYGEKQETATIKIINTDILGIDTIENNVIPGMGTGKVEGSDVNYYNQYGELYSDDTYQNMVAIISMDENGYYIAESYVPEITVGARFMYNMVQEPIYNLNIESEDLSNFINDNFDGTSVSVNMGINIVGSDVTIEKVSINRFAQITEESIDSLTQFNDEIVIFNYIYCSMFRITQGQNSFLVLLNCNY